MNSQNAVHTSIAVIGGSGLYQLFEGADTEQIHVPTPFGTSVVLTQGSLGGRKVVFLPRHGSDHSVPPHAIPARAMIWALAASGVTTLISTAAVGSLNPALPVGTIALADQLVDRTHGREDTYFDGSVVRHLPFSDPFGSGLRALAVAACPDVVDGATVVVVQGPRFSTRAESQLNRAAGIDLVNMTLYPEAALAAELGIDMVALCVVTDLDSGERQEDAVTADIVFARLAEARPRIVSAIERIVQAVPADYVPRELIDRAAVVEVLGAEVR
ncbi:MTAP family purine nucleoside phosphorylase [uncultured Microbacterium sp.]|uniref:MTAP family purine nucleoside phosphorylase n=1 Tax=uncultured Microbacterium sp. TaxID=191216 RepID=UPI0035C9BE52